jgi:NADH-quinone oxidoreductase subunit F
VIPGGSSAKVLKAGEKFKIKRGDEQVEIGLEDIPMDFDTMAACGSMAGSGGVIVIDDSRPIAWVLNNINAFYAHESCGQCTPCREGSPVDAADHRPGGCRPRLPRRHRDAQIGRRPDRGKTICAFGEACSWPTQSFVLKFITEV